MLSSRCKDDGRDVVDTDEVVSTVGNVAFISVVVVLDSRCMDGCDVDDSDDDAASVPLDDPLFCLASANISRASFNCRCKFASRTSAATYNSVAS